MRPETLKLSNGKETFMISQLTLDDDGPVSGKDSRGVGYTKIHGVWRSDDDPAEKLEEA
jgi:hypothetical protein